MPQKQPLNAALGACQKILEGCSADQQPSEALLQTVVALIDRKEGIARRKVEEFMASFKAMEERIRRLELRGTISESVSQKTPAGRQVGLLGRGGRHAPAPSDPG